MCVCNLIKQISTNLSQSCALSIEELPPEGAVALVFNSKIRTFSTFISNVLILEKKLNVNKNEFQSVCNSKDSDISGVSGHNDDAALDEAAKRHVK